VDNLNALNSAIRGQVGTSGGSLVGNGLVTGLEGVLNRLTSYHPGSGVQSLADLGITFDATGKASFDQDTFNALSGTQVSDALKFLGSSTTGLGSYAASLTQYSDPLTGLFASAEAGLDQTDQHLQSQISALADRINAMQTNLSHRLAVADSHVARLSAQQTALSASLQGLSLVLYGQNPTQA
jgi:flagellar capping protein FliD